MNLKKIPLLLTGIAVLGLASCSGVHHACTTNCGPGNAKVTITLYDTPPTGLDVLSFTLPIAGISLTPSSGSLENVTVTISPVEVIHLQTDSTVIVDAASVPAGTYTSLNVTIGPTTANSNIFINTSGSTIAWTSGGGGSCANFAVCYLPAGAIFTVNIPLTSFTLSGNQNQWVGLNLNLNNAITTTGGLSVDFSQANVLTATTTTRTGIPSGAVDTMEDFVGIVTAYTAGSSITVTSGTNGEVVTAKLNSSTAYDSPLTYSTCVSAAACLRIGSTVSIDTSIASDGSLTATEVDVLDQTAIDEVEGTIYPTSNPNVFGLILADKIASSSGSALSSSSITYGTGVFLTITSAQVYAVDTKTLSSIFTPTVGFSNSADLLAGQRVRAQVTGVASGNNGVTATATNLLLRFSRITGTAVVAGSTQGFTLTPPSYISALNTGFVPPLVSYTFPNNTVFDGLTDASGVTAGESVSIRALFLNSTAPTFAVAKVRVP